MAGGPRTPVWIEWRPRGTAWGHGLWRTVAFDTDTELVAWSETWMHDLEWRRRMPPTLAERLMRRWRNRPC